MDYFNDHKKLYLTALALFVALTLAVVIIPAIHNQNINSPLPGAEPLTGDALAGKAIYVANGCVACHTQQVRNIAMDKVWGIRPSIAADYAGIHRTDFWRNTATLMGTERTGPDLTDIGRRQPSEAWHLLHLYQPRAVVAQSIMPAYPWLFEEKKELEPGDVEIKVPEEFREGVEGKIVAKEKALQLVAYLKSLKQVELPNPATAPEFLTYKKKSELIDAPATGGESEATAGLDGAALYATYCQACHQANGEGLAGAFPPLKGSPIVTAEDPEMLIDIIMHGYDARAEYAVMSAVGTLNNLSAEEIAAIINHERTSWGNSAKEVPVAEVEKIMEFLNKNI